MEGLNGGLFSGFGVVGISGLLYTYPKLMKWAKDKLLRTGEEAIEFSHNHFMLNVFLKYPFLRLLSDRFIKKKKKKKRSRAALRAYQLLHCPRSCYGI